MLGRLVRKHASASAGLSDAMNTPLPGVSTSLKRYLTMSYVEGCRDPPLRHLTLDQYFRSEILPSYADRPALICPKETIRPHGGPQVHNLREKYLTWSFAELDRHIASLSRGLVSLGIRKGDRVAVVMGNNSAYAILQWACARIGAILVTLNPAYRANEFVSALRLVEASTLVIVPNLRSSNYISVLSTVIPSILSSSPANISSESLPHLRSLVVVNNLESSEAFMKIMEPIKSAIDFRELFLWSASPEDAYIKDIFETMDYDDVINLQFTSGTTGVPKAVSLTNQLLNNALAIGRCMKLTSDDKLCIVPPLFHCFGLVLGNLAAWVYGASIVYPSEVFHPPSVVDALIEERCTALHGVPTHFLGVLDETSKRGNLKFPTLRTGIAAGSSIPEELMRQLIDKLNLTELTIAYGMTETSPVSFQTVPEDPLVKRIESVGRVLPHVKAKIIDNEGCILPVNTPGELCVSGYLVQKGYWNAPDQTAAVMKRHLGSDDLWMHTGDEAIMDEEGYLHIVSRIKDIIIRGGENLFPVQIENVITSHRSVREAAVIAVPDPTYGEVVGAWIVRHAHETPVKRSELRQWVGRQMNPQAQPLWIWFVGEDGVEEELPKTASGKVQKHILREWGAKWAKRDIGKVV